MSERPARLPRYHSYLLRMWNMRGETSHAPQAWRFSLQDVRTEEQRGFPDLESLVAYLRTRMENSNDG